MIRRLALGPAVRLPGVGGRHRWRSGDRHRARVRGWQIGGWRGVPTLASGSGIDPVSAGRHRRRAGDRLAVISRGREATRHRWGPAIGSGCAGGGDGGGGSGGAEVPTGEAASDTSPLGGAAPSAGSKPPRSRGAADWVRRPPKSEARGRRPVRCGPVVTVSLRVGAPDHGLDRFGRARLRLGRRPGPARALGRPEIDRFAVELDHQLGVGGRIGGGRLGLLAGGVRMARAIGPMLVAAASSSSSDSSSSVTEDWVAGGSSSVPEDWIAVCSSASLAALGRDGWLDVGCRAGGRSGRRRRSRGPRSRPAADRLRPRSTAGGLRRHRIRPRPLAVGRRLVRPSPPGRDPPVGRHRARARSPVRPRRRARRRVPVHGRSRTGAGVRGTPRVDVRSSSRLPGRHRRPRARCRHDRARPPPPLRRRRAVSPTGRPDGAPPPRCRCRRWLPPRRVALGSGPASGSWSVETSDPDSGSAASSSAPSVVVSPPDRRPLAAAPTPGSEPIAPASVVTGRKASASSADRASLGGDDRKASVPSAQRATPSTASGPWPRPSGAPFVGRGLLRLRVGAGIVAAGVVMAGLVRARVGGGRLGPHWLRDRRPRQVDLRTPDR